MAEVPTVRVVNPSNPDEFIILNESDYDPDEYTLWEERDAGGEEPSEVSDPLLEGTVGELEEALPEIEDTDRLEALLEAEDRVTAVEAIEDRLEELEG